MEKWPCLENMVDKIVLDNMNNDFIMETGSWPEGYFFTDEHGEILWKSTVQKTIGCTHFVEEAEQYLEDLNKDMWAQNITMNSNQIINDTKEWRRILQNLFTKFDPVCLN